MSENNMRKPVNVMEELVECHLNELLQNSKTLKCTCDQCINDVYALTLNNLPPKYASTLQGTIEVKAMYSNIYAQAEIKRELIRSMIVVSTNPTHN